MTPMASEPKNVVWQSYSVDKTQRRTLNEHTWSSMTVRGKRPPVHASAQTAYAARIRPGLTGEAGEDQHFLTVPPFGRFGRCGREHLLLIRKT